MQTTKFMNTQGGFTALLSAIIISVLLLDVLVSVGMRSFFSRFNILDLESREQSFYLAEACSDMALLYVAINDMPTTYPFFVEKGEIKCTITSITKENPTVEKTTIRTHAKVNQAYTYLKIIANTSDLAITSFEEE